MIQAAGGSLARMASLGVKELRKLAKGVGLAKACEMAAAFELGKRLAKQTAQSEPLGTPEKIYAFMGPLLQNLPRESLRVVLLDTRHRLIHQEEVSLGTINESLAHPREILRPAISHGAYAFVLVHNHPSGDSTPSEADRSLTRRIREAADLMQIHLLDHVIIGRQRPSAPPYFSFKEHGPGNTFLLYGALNAVFIVFFLVLVPETKDVSLESIEKKLLAGAPLKEIGR